MKLERKYDSLLQDIASCIDGYAPGERYRSGRDDGYYEQTELDDKIKYVMSYSDLFDEFVTIDDAKKIVDFLDLESNKADDYYWAFQALDENYISE